MPDKELMPEVPVQRSRFARLFELLFVLGAVAGIMFYLDHETTKRQASDAQRHLEELDAVYDKTFWAGAQAAFDEVARSKTAAGDQYVLDIQMEHIVNAWKTNQFIKTGISKRVIVNQKPKP